LRLRLALEGACRGERPFRDHGDAFLGRPLFVLGVGWNFAFIGAYRGWCWRRIGHRSATRCRPSTISWCSGLVMALGT
jgi:hypothetical protein